MRSEGEREDWLKKNSNGHYKLCPLCIGHQLVTSLSPLKLSLSLEYMISLGGLHLAARNYPLQIAKQNTKENLKTSETLYSCEQAAQVSFTRCVSHLLQRSRERFLDFLAHENLQISRFF